MYKIISMSIYLYSEQGTREISVRILSILDLDGISGRCYISCRRIIKLFIKIFFR